MNPTRRKAVGALPDPPAAAVRNKLGPGRTAVVDEDDVVADAFADFFRAMEAGQFATLDDRHDLWQVLVMLTERRVVDQIRRERAIKRSAAKAVSPGAMADDAAHQPIEQDNISQVTDGEPTPAFATETCRAATDPAGGTAQRDDAGHCDQKTRRLYESRDCR